MSNDLYDIVYFCPSMNPQQDQEEIESIYKVVEVLKIEADIHVNVCPSWVHLIKILEGSKDKKILIVFRLDFLERSNMLLDEVLSMLSSLIKFLSSNNKIKLSVVVPKPCSQDLILKLKRNNVLGIIPGIRFFDKSHSIESYKTMRQGIPHWPSVALSNIKKIDKKEVKLTKRQYDIFVLVAKRGLSNRKVAELLNIKEDTVKTHVGKILKLYGVRNRTQLALANETGIIK